MRATPVMAAGSSITYNMEFLILPAIYDKSKNKHINQMWCVVGIYHFIVFGWKIVAFAGHQCEKFDSALRMWWYYDGHCRRTNCVTNFSCYKHKNYFLAKFYSFLCGCSLWFLLFNFTFVSDRPNEVSRQYEPATVINIWMNLYLCL